MYGGDRILRGLKKKGWNEEELLHADAVFSQHTDAHHILPPIYDKIIHWVFFGVISLGNIFIFLILIPPLYLFNNSIIFGIVSIVALGFGSIYDIIFKHMAGLKKQHQISIGILLPAITIMSFSWLTIIANTVFIPDDAMILRHPYILSTVYTISLLIPYYLRVTIESIQSSKTR